LKKMPFFNQKLTIFGPNKLDSFFNHSAWSFCH
jgi:hypothetical protein